MKNEIRELIHVIEGYDFEGSLEDVITMLQKYQTDYQEKYKILELKPRYLQ